MNRNRKDLETIRSDAKEIFAGCLSAVDPYKAVKRFVHLDGDRLVVGMQGGPETEINLSKFDRISLVGAGKATAPMAGAIEDMFGERIRKGLINVKYGFTQELAVSAITEAGHPVPDENGVKGTGKILDFLQKAGKKNLIFSLISGGDPPSSRTPGEISLFRISRKLPGNCSRVAPVLMR